VPGQVGQSHWGRANRHLGRDKCSEVLPNQHWEVYAFLTDDDSSSDGRGVWLAFFWM
jgi:hypothetical protein